MPILDNSPWSITIAMFNLEVIRTRSGRTGPLIEMAEQVVTNP